MPYAAAAGSRDEGRPASDYPRRNAARGLAVAIDTPDEPFYGKTPQLRADPCKARAKAGTRRFFRIASAYVIWHEVRLTLALTCMSSDQIGHTNGQSN